MKTLGKITLAMLLMVVTEPTIAASESGHGMRSSDYVSDTRLINHAPPPGFGIASPYDRPGLGPYDDGNYMRNHRNWMRLPPSAHGG